MTSPPPRSDNARATPVFSPGLAFRDGVTASVNTTASTGVARDVAMGLYRARDVTLDGVAARANTTARVGGECSDTRRA